MTFKTCTDLYTSQFLAPRLAVDRKKRWDVGDTIQIGFLGASEYQLLKVMNIASEWLHYTNLHFSWNMNWRSDNMSDRSDVRISFQRGKGSWSYVGMDAMTIENQKDATMNFGWLDESTPEEEWERVVLHEFGHMLGAIHEHQSPATNIKWDLPLLYQYYWETQGWSKEQVDFNIVRKYDKDISNTEFDRESIMLYPIEQKFTLDDFSVGWNRQLSDQDKRFIAEMYS
jgi:hypothetical protein